jgi:REP element-mobilizing transposase RayT
MLLNTLYRNRSRQRPCTLHDTKYTSHARVTHGTNNQEYTAKKIFNRHPEVKQILNGGKFWTSGYYINAVGKYANEQVISNYVKKQGNTYQQLH